MDNSFNGLRYCATLGCLINDSGDKVRMRRGSTQIFLLLKQNMNKLVTREHLLGKVPYNGAGNGPVNGLNSNDSLDDSLDEKLNECIDEIRHVVSDDRLKTIPHVGYLLTPDATAEESVKLLNVRSGSSGDRIRRPMPALIQGLVFNSQWVISGYQRSPFVWVGIFFLVALLVLSSFVATASSTGHVAFDRTGVNSCPKHVAYCTACIPSFWQTSSSLAHSNWFMPSVCSAR